MASSDNRDLPVRRYNDAEVRELLERATRLQGRAPTPVRTHGLTLEQIEDIAAEAHIDVARLRDAARELDMERATRPATAMERLVGAPLRVQVERTLPFEVDADALGTLGNTIGATTGDNGTSSLIGRTFTWNAHATSGRRLDVRVTVQKGRTHIHIEERYSEPSGALFGSVIGGVGGGVGFGGGAALASAIGSAAVAVAFPIAVVGASYGACRFGFRAWVRNRARIVGTLCDRIAQDLTALHESER